MEAIVVAVISAIGLVSVELLRRLRKENSKQHDAGRDRIVELHADVRDTRDDVREIKRDLHELKKDLREIDGRVERLEF